MNDLFAFFFKFDWLGHSLPGTLLYVVKTDNQHFTINQFFVLIVDFSNLDKRNIVHKVAP